MYWRKKCWPTGWAKPIQPRKMATDGILRELCSVLGPQPDGSRGVFRRLSGGRKVHLLGVVSGETEVRPCWSWRGKWNA